MSQDEVDLFEIERQLDTRMKEVIEKQQAIDIDEINWAGADSGLGDGQFSRLELIKLTDDLSAESKLN